MRNSSGDGKLQQKSLRGGGSSKLYGLLRIVSSGASTVARSAANVVAQTIADRSDGGGGDASHDQVLCASFDKLEGEGNLIRQVLLLGYRSGFQVWDVEEAHNVRDLVSRHDGPASFLHMLPKPIASKKSGDKFSDSRPILVVCTDGAFSGVANTQDGSAALHNGNMNGYQDSANCFSLPTIVRFYSLSSQSYVHELKFRSVVYSVRCSSRILAISQAAQIHCFDSSTLERDYTILTNPVVMSAPGLGGVGYGPLAVGSRWLAYSGSPVMVPNSGRVNPQHLTSSASFSGLASNGSLVAHYAKESSKQLAASIATLGDMGYKRLSRYCAELLPESKAPPSTGWKPNGTVNGHLQDSDNIGMVVVRDIVKKFVIAQFRAHKSPISALCFDPSGTLLVTASVQGHNINVFKIMPGSLSNGDTGVSHVHLYRLQRGITNAVIQDISFSDDSNWIMISSSRGTSHLFAVNPSGGTINFQSSDGNYSAKIGGPGGTTKTAGHLLPSLGSQMHNQQSLCASGPPVTLSVVSRIRNGSNGWRGTVTGAAAAASGRLSSFSGAIASSFHKCKGANEASMNGISLKTKHHLLVFSPLGSMIQYAFRIPPVIDSTAIGPGSDAASESAPEVDGRLVVEAIQKWNMCQKQSQKDREENVDIYGENGPLESSKIYLERRGRMNGTYAEGNGAVRKTKISPEEKYQLYISEAELQMHDAISPLWAKPEIYFQSMMTESKKLEGGSGEIEIERIPTRMVEARSKDLIPLFDFFPAAKYQSSSYPTINGHINGRLQHQRFGLSENGSISRRGSSASLNSMSGSASEAELRNGTEESECDSPWLPKETRGFVNSNESLKRDIRHGFVNNKENFSVDAQIKFVNSKNLGFKVENHFEDEGDEFD